MSNFNDPIHDQQDGEAQYALASSPRSRRSSGSSKSSNIPSIAQAILLSNTSTSSPDLPFSLTTPPSPTVQLSPGFASMLPHEPPTTFLLVCRENRRGWEDERKEDKADNTSESTSPPSRAASFRLKQHHTPDSNPELCHFAEDMLHHSGTLLVTPPSRMMLNPLQRPSHTPYNSPEVFHLDDGGHPDHEPIPEFVTKALIHQWNNEIGNSHNVSKATKLIEKMRQLGGLDPLADGGPVDIPAARIGLCLLAGLNNQENKMHALTSLLEILKSDNYTKADSIQLVSLAIQLLRLMNREVIQAVDLEAQSKIAEVYNVLAETLHHHYGKHHINALTEELKQQLVQTAKSIERLNRLEDMALKFHAHCALEGVRRLKDDKQELFDIAERLYYATTGAIQIYMQEAAEGFAQLEAVFAGLDPHLPSSWYDAILVLKSMARDVKEDPKQLTPLLMFIGQNYQKLNWKFSYAAVQVLFQLSLHGANEKVRFRAFNGVKQLGRAFPGLSSFADCDDLKDYTSYKPMVHLERPHTIDPNIRIRHAAIKYLHEVLEKSEDEQIRKKAAFLLSRREKLERDPHVMRAIKRNDSF